MIELALRSDKGLTLQMSAIKTFYGDQYTLSTQLIEPNYRVFKDKFSATMDISSIIGTYEE